MKRVLLCLLLLVIIVPSAIWWLTLREQITFAEQYPNEYRSTANQETQQILSIIQPFVDKLHYPIEVYSYHYSQPNRQLSLSSTAGVTAPFLRSKLNQDYERSMDFAADVANSEYYWAGIYRVCNIRIGTAFPQLLRKLTLYHELGHCWFNSPRDAKFIDNLVDEMLEAANYSTTSENVMGLRTRASEAVAMFTAAIGGYDAGLIRSPMQSLADDMGIVERATKSHHNYVGSTSSLYSLLAETNNPTIAIRYINQNAQMQEKLRHHQPIKLFDAIIDFYHSSFFRDYLIQELRQKKAQ